VEEDLLNMPSFKDTSKLTSTIDLFNERVNYTYNVDYQTSTIGSKPYVDRLDYEFVFYGRVDQLLRPRVIATNKFLKPVKASQNRSGNANVIRLVSPAADAANGFIREYQRAYTANKLDKGEPYLSSIVPLKGHISFTKEYATYMSRIFNIFIDKFISTHGHKYNNLTTFSDFLNAFRAYCLEYPQVVITPSGFMLTNQCNPFVSGLMFSIADLSLSDNSIKYEDFVQSPNGVLYQKIAVKHGLSIDKNRPWVLVADLKSPAFKDKYFSRYDTELGVGSFFNNFYSQPFSDDIIVLRNTALDFYNQMITARPNDVQVSDSNCAPKPVRINRVRNTMSRLKSNYPEQYWLDFYIDLKVKEVGLSNFQVAKVREIKTTARDTLQHFDLTKAVSYVNFSMRREVALRSGSFYNAKQKHARRNGNVKSDKTSGNQTSNVVQSIQITGGGSGGSGY
jgi:hypothetical protein